MDDTTRIQTVRDRALQHEWNCREKDPNINGAQRPVSDAESEPAVLWTPSSPHSATPKGFHRSDASYSTSHTASAEKKPGTYSTPVVSTLLGTRLAMA